MSRRWIPEAFLDEIVPDPLADPNDFAFEVDGQWVLRDAVEDGGGFADVPLNDGDMPNFCWMEDLGLRLLTIHPDWSWSLDEPAPDAPEGGSLQVKVHFWPDSARSGFQELVDDIRTGGLEDPRDFPEEELPIDIYAWADGGTPFLFRAGRLVVAGDGVL